MDAASTDRRIAVVMITHNRRAEVLRSLRHFSSMPEQPRIVLVDNGSTDDTASAVARQFPQVEILDAGGNIGAAGRTLGVRHVDTPYVALCDDDTWWNPGDLGRAADLMDAHPRLAIITARVLIGPEERPDPACREAGGFAPHLFIGGEEELLATDLAAAGWWLCYVPELTVHHYPSRQRDRPARRSQLVRNGLWFAWMRRPLAGALRRTLALAHAATRDQDALHGFASALPGLPWALSQRRVGPPEIERGRRQIEVHGGAPRNQYRAMFFDLDIKGD